LSFFSFNFLKYFSAADEKRISYITIFSENISYSNKMTLPGGNAISFFNHGMNSFSNLLAGFSKLLN